MNTIFQVITLAWTLQGGQYVSNAMNDSGVFTSNTPYFTDVTLELQVPLSFTKGDKNNLFIATDTENQFFKQASGYAFDPWQISYKFSAGVRLYGIEIGFDHSCTHPIISSYSDSNSSFFHSFDKVYIKTSGYF